jgi:hypothetical protein
LKFAINSLQFTYQITDGGIYPPPNATTPWTPDDLGPWPEEVEYDIHWWFFSIHYLSLCGGFVGGTEDPEYYTVQCERKAAGWRFRSDDPYIVNFLSVDGQLPVNSTVPFQTFTTAPAVGSLLSVWDSWRQNWLEVG